ncbi:MAG: DUF2157 domain-containing protein [Actinobacteria bacterium]|nr:DUF2157 domain-containing protein [Actinomycetota bacterium]
MIQGIIPVLVIVAIVGGISVWLRRRGRVAGAEGWRDAPPAASADSQRIPARRPAGPAPGGPGSLAGDLARWVGAGLIGPEDADAIATFEQARVAGAVGAGGERRVSLLAEALGYVGVVLALAGAGVGVGHAWDDLPTWAHLGIPLAATVLLVAGGLLLRKQEEPAFERLMGVLWMLAVGTTAWALVVFGVEVADLDAEPSAVLVGAGCTAVALSLWSARPSGFQQTALLGSIHVLVIAGILWASADEPPVWWMAVAVWAIGAIWATLGWRNLMEPSWLAVGFGCLGMVIGPATGLGEYEWLLAPALLTAAGLMAVSIPTRQTPLLALGTVGAFGYITWAVVHYFQDSLGVPLALVIVGAVFLGLAVLAGRLGTREARRGAPHLPAPG